MSETCKRCHTQIPMSDIRRCKCMDNNDHANECEYIANEILTDESLIFAAACVREKAIVIRNLIARIAALEAAIEKHRNDLAEAHEKKSLSDVYVDIDNELYNALNTEEK